MAYNFVRASSQHLLASSTPITAMPITIFGRFKSDSSTTDQSIVYVGNSGSNRNWFGCYLNGGSASDFVGADHADSGTVSEALTTTGFSTSVWQSAMGVFASTVLRDVYINGGSTGQNTTSRSAPSGLNNIGVGILKRSTNTNLFSGDLAELAIWSVADLTSAEIQSLNSFKPSRIRPQSLIVYLPIVRNIQDLRSGTAFSAVNSPTVANHPRVY